MLTVCNLAERLMLLLLGFVPACIRMYSDVVTSHIFLFKAFCPLKLLATREAILPGAERCLLRCVAQLFVTFLPSLSQGQSLTCPRSLPSTLMSLFTLFLLWYNPCVALRLFSAAHLPGCLCCSLFSLLSDQCKGFGVQLSPHCMFSSSFLHSALGCCGSPSSPPSFSSGPFLGLFRVGVH